MYDKIDEALNKTIDNLNLTRVNGRITESTGQLLRAIVPGATIGHICSIKRYNSSALSAQIVGFGKNNEVLLAPLGDTIGIGPNSEVVLSRRPLEIHVGDGLLGRVLNGLGEPLDVKEKGPLTNVDKVQPVLASPPDSLKRPIITTPLTVGIKAIDGVLTIGKGQRVGIFAAAGGGKSTALGQISRYAEADINVIALIGERGREVREFMEHDLGPEGMKRSVIIVSTSDEPAQVRLNAAYVGTAIAEYFRDQGKNVILMMDSVTRFARAVREIGLAAGEPPARAGFTPSVFATLPKLLERSGTSEKGSITAFYTVLVEGDNMEEPVADEVRSILDGHIILSRDLAGKGHYPAIDILLSASRILTNITKPEHVRRIQKLREVIANHKKIELLLRIGEYKRGADPEADFAINHIDKVNSFLKQGREEHFSFEETLDLLKAIFP